MFDKALKGKKIQIEPYRGRPDSNKAKGYVRTTTINEPEKTKIVEKLTTNLFISGLYPFENEQNQISELIYSNIEGLTKLKTMGWHEPIIDGELTLYNYSAVYKPKGSTFGKVRMNSNGTKKAHTGLDIFAEKGTQLYACLDGKIERIYGSSSDGSYGNVIVLEVDMTEEFILAKNNYQLTYTDEIEKGPDFNLNGKIYLRYAHVQQVDVQAGQSVNAGDPIGLSGVTGNATGTRAPHLHFEIANKPRPGRGLINRCNPSFYVNIIPEESANKEHQKNISKTRHYS